MPSYTYVCKNCEYIFSKFHSIHSRLTDCPQCKQLNTLQRKIEDIRVDNSKPKERAVGETVKETIEEEKRILEEEKERLRNRNLWNG